MTQFNHFFNTGIGEMEIDDDGDVYVRVDESLTGVGDREFFIHPPNAREIAKWILANVSEED